MKKLLLSLSLLSANVYAQSSVIRWVSLESVSTEAHKFNCDGCMYRNSYLPEHDKDWIYGLYHTTKVDIFKVGDFNFNLDNKFFLEGVHQVEYAGLHYELSMSLNRYFDIGKYHESHHAMDVEPQNGQPFPLKDSYFIRLNWFNRGR